MPKMQPKTQRKQQRKLLKPTTRQEKHKTKQQKLSKKQQLARAEKLFKDLGVDIDPKAEDIARDNAAINGLGADRFTACTGDVIGNEVQMKELSEGGYDLVLANIVADVIIPLASVVPNFLREGARFICSGILYTRLPEVLAAIKAAGLTVESTETMDDWCRVTAHN